MTSKLKCKCDSRLLDLNSNFKQVDYYFSCTLYDITCNIENIYIYMLLHQEFTLNIYTSYHPFVLCYDCLVQRSRMPITFSRKHARKFSHITVVARIFAMFPDQSFIKWANSTLDGSSDQE